jgi:hypothetical protein
MRELRRGTRRLIDGIGFDDKLRPGRRRGSRIESSLFVRFDDAALGLAKIVRENR